MANPTASESGTKSWRPTPAMNNAGMNTDNTHNIDSSRGVIVLRHASTTARAYDVPRLVEDEVDLDVFRRDVPHRGKCPADVADDIKRRCIRTLGHGDVNRALVVDVRIANDDVRRVRDGPDVPQIHGWTCADPERRVE